MTHDATVDRLLARVVPGVRVQRSVLDALLHNRPDAETLARLLAAPDPTIVCAALLYLHLYGTLRESAVLALCLHHEDLGVTRLAEHALWSVWMQCGSEEGNRHLATAVGLLKAGDYAAALDLLNRLVAREPEFAEAHFQRGLALCSLDRHEEATAAYRRALRLNPYHFGAVAALGHACVERGNIRAALHHYRHALRIHPHLEDVPNAIRELESFLRSHRGNAV